MPLWSTAGIDTEVVRQVALEYGLPSRVARVLCTRVGVDDIPLWLQPERVPYSSPALFWDMKSAVERIKRAVTAGERIGVIGDYDVDGVTATAIVATTFEALGADFRCYIPHRVDDGYGLSQDLVDRAKGGGCGLIVTVDNGIRANGAVDYAAELGMDVVITDHHEPGEEPPHANAVVHFTRADDPGLSVLSGAGVAWKLANALLDSESYAGQELRKWHIGLAALGALADIMPMKGENRRLVREGIEVLRTISQPGWLALCDVAGVNQATLNETTILWSITPRINAAGRMDSAETALLLLLAKDVTSAARFALEVEERNADRRRETTRATTAAEKWVEDTYGEDNLPSVIVVAGPWPLGVVGIVAAKLSDAYHRPAIVFADDGNELLRGSGRAPDGLPFYDAVSGCSHLLEHFGGHSTALGCGVSRDKLDLFCAAVCARMTDYKTSVSIDHEQAMTDGVLPVADDYLPLHEATIETARWLTNLGPYGPGYPPYRYYVGPVEVTDLTAMGAGKHLRLAVREGRAVSRLIWFNPPEWAFQMERGTSIGAVVALEINTWQGREQPQLRVESAFVLARPVLREDFARVYRLLQARRKLLASDIRQTFQAEALTPVQTIFDTFVDLGFAYLEESAYHVVEQAQTQDLRESIVYQTHLRAAAVQRTAMGQ